MIFNSYTFIAFFIIVLLLHHMKFSWTAKKRNLLLASYVFYAAWNPPFILLLWLSTVVDFFVGKALYREENKRRKKLLLVVSLIGNLGMLCFFKYGGFLLENFACTPLRQHPQFGNHGDGEVIELHVPGAMTRCGRGRARTAARTSAQPTSAPPRRWRSVIWA